MSLWDYFKREGPLPDPKGSLARVMPSSAIAVANVEVEKSTTGIRSKSQKGLKKRVYTPRERAQIGKLACTIGATAAAKSFSRKLGVKINESTVRGFKKSYIAERSAKRLVLRGQIAYFSAGRYRLQYKRPHYFSAGAYTASDNALR